MNPHREREPFLTEWRALVGGPAEKVTAGMPSRFAEIRSSNPLKHFGTTFRNLAKSSGTPSAALRKRQLRPGIIWKRLEPPSGFFQDTFGPPLGPLWDLREAFRNSTSPGTRSNTRNLHTSRTECLLSAGRWRCGRGAVGDPTPGPRKGNLNENPARRAFGNKI